MAKKDARIRFLERELAEREREMESMVTTGEEEVSGPGVDDERMRDLELRMQDLEALVKGLTAEILDLKSVTADLSRDLEVCRVRPMSFRERPIGDVARAKPQTSVGPRVRAEPRTLAYPAGSKTSTSAVAEEDLDLIMQNDGTLKPEPRRSSEYIVAGTKPLSKSFEIRGKGGKSSGRTQFVEQKKRKVEDVIQAEDDDTLDIGR